MTRDEERAYLEREIADKLVELRRLRRAVFRLNTNDRVRSLCANTTTSKVLAYLEADGKPRRLGEIMSVINPAYDDYTGVTSALHNLCVKSGLVVHVRRGVYRALSTK